MAAEAMKTFGDYVELRGETFVGLVIAAIVLPVVLPLAVLGWIVDALGLSKHLYISDEDTSR